MDPITIAMISVAVIGLLVSGGVAMDLFDRTYNSDDEDENGQQQLAQSRLLLEASTGESDIDLEKILKIRLGRVQRIIREVEDNVDFTTKRVLVGTEVVGQKSLGFERQEVPWPADDINVRPMQDMSELDQVLPAELLADDDLALARIATGEVLIAAPVEEKELTEDEHRKIWKDVKHVLYVLLDISPSMYERREDEYGIVPQDIWRPLVVALLERTVESGAIFMSRDFHGGISELRRAVNSEQARVLKGHFLAVSEENYTNIPRAIYKAIGDFTDEDHNQAEIVIITDGENNQGIDPDKMRRKLQEAGIKLHAILIGVNNDRLRQCADICQTISIDGGGNYDVN